MQELTVGHIIAAVLISISLACCIRSLNEESDSWWRKRAVWAYLLVGIWALGTPIWFLIEWCDFPNDVKEIEFEKFKYSQELARNIWAAVVIMLGSITKIKWGG